MDVSKKSVRFTKKCESSPPKMTARKCSACKSKQAGRAPDGAAGVHTRELNGTWKLVRAFARLRKLTVDCNFDDG